MKLLNVYDMRVLLEKMRNVTFRGVKTSQIQEALLVLCGIEKCSKYFMILKRLWIFEAFKWKRMLRCFLVVKLERWYSIIQSVLSFFFKNMTNAFGSAILEISNFRQRTQIYRLMIFTLIYGGIVIFLTINSTDMWVALVLLFTQLLFHLMAFFLLAVCFL